MIPWVYPLDRYYYGWYDDPVAQRTDGDIKAVVVDRLDVNELTRDVRIEVDVKQHVVVLGGTVGSTLAKRAAGDDAWGHARSRRREQAAGGGGSAAVRGGGGRRAAS